MNFRSKNILVTGGSGFIGSNFINYILNRYKDINVINIDKLTYAGSEVNTLKFKYNIRYNFIKCDICDLKSVQKVFNQFKIDGVINFAAETHVDNSIVNSNPFVNTNVFGTYNLLQCSYKYWFEAPNKIKPQFINSRFHQISTDEIYGSIKIGSFNENSQYLPNSPYSASKASADMLVRSFNKTFGLNVTTSVCSNNYGPNQHVEKLIPKVLECIRNDEQIPLYGKGKNVRNWIHVIDHCSAIDLIFNKGKNGEKYNVGSNFEISNIELVRLLCKLNNVKENIILIADRHGHDFRYSLNSEKIKSELNWRCKYNFNNYFKSTLI